MVCLQKELFLYDWLTVSAPAPVSALDLICLLGLESLSWVYARGSKLRYEGRYTFGGISVHCTFSEDGNFNQGACLEMSGTGCRDFEQYSVLSWSDLFTLILQAGWNVTRVDIAFDDRNNHFPKIPLDQMAVQAMARKFLARSRSFRVTYDSDLGKHDSGISVCHGSKSSSVYIRCYDKRVERGRYELVHWVRLEIQLRGSAASGWVKSTFLPAFDFQKSFFGLFSQYVVYIDSVGSTRTVSRSNVSDWFARLCAGSDPVELFDKLTPEYNKGALDRFIYNSCYNAIAAEILSDGLPAVLSKIFDHVGGDLPEKYVKVLSDFLHIDPSELVSRSLSDQLTHFSADLQRFLSETT